MAGLTLEDWKRIEARPKCSGCAGDGVLCGKCKRPWIYHARNCDQWSAEICTQCNGYGHILEEESDIERARR
jgi:hypothetical protein